MVERWFRDLTDKRIRRGVFKSVAELIAAIQAYIRITIAILNPLSGLPKPKISSPNIDALRPSWIKYKQHETLH